MNAGMGDTAGAYAVHAFSEGMNRLAQLLTDHPELRWVQATSKADGHVEIFVDAGTGVLHDWVHALPAARRKQDLFSLQSGAAVEQVLIDGSLMVHVRPRGDS